MNSSCTVKQLVAEVKLDDMLKRLRKYYARQDNYSTTKVDQIIKAYNQMRRLEAAENEDYMTLWIWVYVFTDRDRGSIFPAQRVQDYLESDYSARNDIEQIFKVCAVDMHYDNDLRYSYSGLSGQDNDIYRQYLSLYIEDETLEGFSKETLLAILLWDFCE